VLYWFRTDDNITGGITINMAAGTVIGDASVGHDTLRSIEAVRATDFADTYNASGFTTTSINGPNVGDAGFAIISGVQQAFNEFEGMGGDDTITGNGNTRIDYVNATDGVTVDLLAGTASGTAPGDLANVGTDHFSGVNSVQGSYFADTLFGSNTTLVTESFDGGAGDDTIDGRGGFDLAFYNNAIGTVSGISVAMAAGTVVGDDSIGTDTLRSIESVRGTNFADIYDATGYGQLGALNIGNNGTFNSFEGLAGDDVITGNGNTQLTFFSATGGLSVDFNTGTATGDASVGTDTFTGVNNVQGSNFNDTLIGAAGNQTFAGRGGADTFVYADNGGADVVTDFTHSQGDKIDLTGVTGIYSLADVQAHATQSSPNTVIDFGGGNTLTLTGVPLANLTTNDFIFANHIVGDNNDNTLVGTAGVDVIEGLGGNDTLTGLGGHDTFVFRTNFGHDTINDFQSGQDSIDIDHTLFPDIAAILNSATPSGSDTIISDAAGDTITLKNVSTVHASDFHLV
jgi:Ca2+-binding RTX toxin-like protein